MKNDNEIIESLIAGGLIGDVLAALLSNNNKGESAMLGALAGATLLATYKANQQAMRTKVPMYVEENGSLYLINLDGTKKFIREIEKSDIELKQRYKLK